MPPCRSERRDAAGRLLAPPALLRVGHSGARDAGAGAGPCRRLDHESLRRAARLLGERDADLASITERCGPVPLWARRPGFPALVRIILEQQVSLAAARTMYLRLARHAGAVSPASIAGLGSEGMRRLGFTRQKAAYCCALAERILAGELDLRRLSRGADEAGRRALLAVPGLGPWSVDIYYLMALRRPDVWPRGDLALATAVMQVKRLRSRPDDAALARIAARWAPWRSVAARLLWQHYLAARGGGRAT